MQIYSTKIRPAKFEMPILDMTTAPPGIAFVSGINVPKTDLDPELHFRIMGPGSTWPLCSGSVPVEK